VPDDPVLEVDDKRVSVTTNEYQGHRRMTLTYPALAEACEILWLVTGEEKRDPLQKLLAADPSIPAGRVRNGSMSIVADSAASPS
jgi:6-phosphogluconolactonase/glucosamine-6-phosphate isomerase/deaminase